MNMITAKPHQLREHPAQMRTRTDPDEMAPLILQVIERSLVEHQPITYHVVSGHRRWLARLLAAEVEGVEVREGEVGLEDVQQGNHICIQVQNARGRVRAGDFVPASTKRLLPEHK